MKTRILSTGIIALSFCVQADIKVSDVKVFSGYPWTEVVVGYTITGSDKGAADIRLTATDMTANKSYTAETLSGGTLTEGCHTMRWNAGAEGVKFSSSNVVFSVSVVEYGSVQLWANGPYWAECNLGASKPEEYGYYFWWGDTVGYKRVDSRFDAVDGSKTGFSFRSENCPTYDKNYATLKSQGYVDESGNLTPTYDAATARLGAPWRMPTDAEYAALISNCTTTWTTRNGVSGLLVSGKGAYASKSIFLPASGFASGSGGGSSDGSIAWYWSSTSYSVYSNYAWSLRFSSSNFDRTYELRYNGQSIRPVR